MGRATLPLRNRSRNPDTPPLFAVCAALKVGFDSMRVSARRRISGSLLRIWRSKCSFTNCSYLAGSLRTSSGMGRPSCSSRSTAGGERENERVLYDCASDYGVSQERGGRASKSDPGNMLPEQLAAERTRKLLEECHCQLRIGVHIAAAATASAAPAASAAAAAATGKLQELHAASGSEAHSGTSVFGSDGKVPAIRFESVGEGDWRHRPHTSSMAASMLPSCIARTEAMTSVSKVGNISLSIAVSPLASPEDGGGAGAAAWKGCATGGGGAGADATGVEATVFGSRVKGCRPEMSRSGGSYDMFAAGVSLARATGGQSGRVQP
jgi:hypothetical protein